MTPDELSDRCAKTRNMKQQEAQRVKEETQWYLMEN